MPKVMLFGSHFLNVQWCPFCQHLEVTVPKLQIILRDFVDVGRVHWIVFQI